MEIFRSTEALASDTCSRLKLNRQFLPGSMRQMAIGTAAASRLNYTRARNKCEQRLCHHHNNNNNNVHLLCAHQRPERSMIHINLNMIFYTHVKHSPTKTVNLPKVLFLKIYK